MTHEEIYKLYRRADYDSPKLLKVLADVCSITVTELKNIIKTEDEKSEMEKLKWTSKMDAELLAKSNAGATNAQLATEYDSTYANIAWRVNMLRKKSGQKKPATVNKDFDEQFDSSTTYTDCAPENISDIDTGEDVSGINAKIRELCETPDPKPKPIKIDCAESLISVLMDELLDRAETIQSQRQGIEFREKLVVDYRRMLLEKTVGDMKPVIHEGLFSRSHQTLDSLEDSIKQADINVDSINLTVNKFIVDVSASNSCGECVGWHKKYQPTECKSED